MDTIIQFFTNGDFWAIIIKALITLLLSAATAWIGTLIANAISKNKDSKMYKYAETLVEAAEQKFPNEGTKMGPQKLDYVMSQLMIKYPNIKNNQYLYNIVEQAVFKLNEKRNQQIDAQNFYNKYGEWPEGYEPSNIENNNNGSNNIEEGSTELDKSVNNENTIIISDSSKDQELENDNIPSTNIQQVVKTKKLKSF